MDRISHLSDDVILKILSCLRTKDVMRTMLLSKRFKSLWISVPRLEFDELTHSPDLGFWGSDSDQVHYYGSFRLFVDRSLMSREGHVLQSLHLKLGRYCTDDDIEIWVRTAVKRRLIELKVGYAVKHGKQGFLPKTLYTCETLVVLNLEKGCLDVPELVSLRSLKTLTLKSMKYSNENALVRLLPNCPVLEDLKISNRQTYPLVFKIVVPSLKKLSLLDAGITELVIDAPSLKYFHIVDRSGGLSFSENINIPEVVEANVEVILLTRPEKLLHSLASAKHIRLCFSAPEVVYPVGSSFPRLEHLEICTCKSEWLDLFMHLLENSPSLKVVKIKKCHPDTNPRPQRKKPDSVPRCFSSNFETLEWIGYEGTQEEKEVSTYILKTAVCLKKASFTAKSNDSNKKLQMLQELALSPRASSTCALVFN